MHKIFTAEQFRQWDAATIAAEQIKSIDLMERAAAKCCEWLLSKKFDFDSVKIFCGKGNNGGDGLAIARLLHERGIKVAVFIVESTQKSSADFQTNLSRLEPGFIHYITSPADFPILQNDDLIIDALFGTGLNKPPAGLFAKLIAFLNASVNKIISIDLPSGLFADRPSAANAVVRASYTVTFGAMKLCMLLPESGKCCGEIVVLDISKNGLHNDSFYRSTDSKFHITDVHDMQRLHRPRNRFSHKGDFGHALIAAGSYGKMGAALLAATACMHSGCGLVTCYIPACGYDIMQTSLPEAMCMVDREEKFLSHSPASENFDAVGVGPGIGTGKPTARFLRSLLKNATGPLVLDADALNIISADPSMLKSIPEHSIITPHPKEFDRLFGKHEDSFARIDSALRMAGKYKIVIVLKGHHTLITNGDDAVFNSTGNAGMAKAGSGDVLTGIITSFMAQRYPPFAAALLGCYLHGLAGDLAAEKLTEEYMTASDIVGSLPRAFTYLTGKEN